MTENNGKLYRYKKRLEETKRGDEEIRKYTREYTSERGPKERASGGVSPQMSNL